MYILLDSDQSSVMQIKEATFPLWALCTAGFKDSEARASVAEQKSDTEIWVGEWERQREDVFIFFSVPVQWGKSYKLSKRGLQSHE